LHRLLNRLPLPSFYTIERIAFASPAARKLLGERYATYRFMWCRAMHKLGILVPATFVQWLATRECNMACEFCEAGAGEKQPDELNYDEVIRLVDDLADMGVERFFISGGEPLVRKDIFEIINHVLERGMKYGIATNGLLVPRHEDEFARMRPYVYFTSLDGLEETNDHLRGHKGAFMQTLDSLDFIKSTGVRHRWVNTVVSTENIDELDALKDVIRQADVTVWRIALLIPVGRAQEKQDMFLDDAGVRRVLDFIRETRRILPVEISEDAGCMGPCEFELRPAPFFCGAGLTRCSIMPDGEVLPCQIAYDNACSEGNVRDKPFSEIWKNGFRQFREPVFENECIECRHFHACRGGCWGMRIRDRHCLKHIWENVPGAGT